MDHFLRSWCFRKYAPLIATLLFVACTETVDESARYVFLHDTAASYLSKHDVYSEYVGLIKKMPISTRSSSTVFQLLSARGHYTVFAPTNNAINQYLVQLATTGIIPTPSWDAFTDSTLLDSIRRVIVMNSIIDGGDVDVYHTYEFPTQTNGEFPRSNMKDVKLTVRYTGNPDEIFICRDCPINVRNRDITATNGVLHQMDRVIAPEDKTMASMLREYLAGRREGFCVMARLCEACGLLDTLSRVRDDRYEQLYQRGLIAPTCPANGMASVYPGQSYTPQHRKYGFTIFAEPDIFWENQLGKDANDITPADIQEWVAQQGYYPEYHSTSDYTSNDNLLYQWTTYHILDYKLAPNRLTYHFCEYGYNYQFSTGRYTIPVMEYYTTFGPRRLLKIYESPEAGGIYLNRFPIIDNQRTGTGHEVGCSPDNAGNRIDNDDPTLALHSASNGYLYSIDTPLAYSPTVRNNLGRERIRIDAASFFPEATNSDIRCQMVDDNEHGWVHIPYDAEYHYFENLNINEGSSFVYCNGFGKNWSVQNCDEIKCVGHWEITFRLPPVPVRNTYEIRYKVYSDQNRGIAQVYFGTDPDRMEAAGIPVDLTMGGDNPRTGWEPDTGDNEYNAEIDKHMHNNGYMKGEKSTDCLGNGGANSRSNQMRNIIRHIIVKQTLDPDRTYYLRLKSVLDQAKPEFHMDWLEWCPKEVYDNPEKPEDIW